MWIVRLEPYHPAPGDWDYHEWEDKVALEYVHHGDEEETVKINKYGQAIVIIRDDNISPNQAMMKAKHLVDRQMEFILGRYGNGDSQ